MCEKHLSKEALEAGLDHIRKAPNDKGTVRMVIRRPRENEREELSEGELTVEEGMVGDYWFKEEKRHPDAQLNIMGSRAIDLIARSTDRWKLAGDQLYIDLNLSFDNVPPGTRLQIGTAIIEVTAIPHRGCGKFAQRFGAAANDFVNGEVGVSLNLRGVAAKVVQSGKVVIGDSVTKVS